MESAERLPLPDGVQYNTGTTKVGKVYFCIALARCDTCLAAALNFGKLSETRAKFNATGGARLRLLNMDGTYCTVHEQRERADNG